MSTVPILIADDDRKNIVIDRPAIVVGRSRRRSDIRIDDRSISAVHCEIEIGENCLQVRNRGRNGIRINGQKSDKGVLRDGDVFEIARMKYRVLMEGNPAHPNASKSSSSNDWFARLAGLELGPMPWSELSLMVQRGELTKTDEVRWSRQRLWRPASEADGLFESKVGDVESADQEVAASHAGDASEPAVEPGNYDSDDRSATIEFEFAEFDSEDSEVETPSLNIKRDQGSNAAEWQLEDAQAELADEIGASEPLVPSLAANTLPPLPVPPPLKATPQAIPQSSPPINIPKVGRSDSWLDVVYHNILEPILIRVPILQTWPGVAAVIAAVLLMFFMMGSTYEGAAVSGKVTLNGQPLSDATISFTDLKNGFGASAIVGPDGTFEVITLKGGMKPGTYNVAVMPLKPESPEIVSELQRQFSESQNVGMHDEEMMMGEGYSGASPSRSSKEPEDESFELPATTIPFNYRSIQTSGISKEITEDGPNELQIELVTN